MNELTRKLRDLSVNRWRIELERSLTGIAISSGVNRLPLNRALEIAQGELKGEYASGEDRKLANLLTLFEVTAVSAASGISGLANAGVDTTGFRDALVDLWVRSEAARSLLFDLKEGCSGEGYAERLEDLFESARVIVPEAIALAMRVAEPVDSFVGFSSEVLRGYGEGRAAR
jgi:hypothetical protein